MAAYERSGLYRPMIVETSARGRHARPARAGCRWSRAGSRCAPTRAPAPRHVAVHRLDRLSLRPRARLVDRRADGPGQVDRRRRRLPDRPAPPVRRLADGSGGLQLWREAVKRAINRQSEDYLDQFWDIYTRLPRETRRFVPRFLATLHILNDPAAYGFELPEPLPAQEYELVEMSARPSSPRSTPCCGSGPDQRGAQPGAAPQGDAGRALLAQGAARCRRRADRELEKLPQWVAPASITTIYRVRRGDTLSGIASRYGTSVSALMDLNNLRSAHRIRQGQSSTSPIAGPRRRLAPRRPRSPTACARATASGRSPSATAPRSTASSGQRLELEHPAARPDPRHPAPVVRQRRHLRRPQRRHPRQDRRPAGCARCATC